LLLFQFLNFYSDKNLPQCACDRIYSALAQRRAIGCSSQNAGTRRRAIGCIFRAIGYGWPPKQQNHQPIGCFGGGRSDHRHIKLQDSAARATQSASPCRHTTATPDGAAATHTAAAHKKDQKIIRENA
jgi:hypothetical protein